MININESNFDEETKDGIVIVDFYAEWCGPCKVLGPILEKIIGAKVVKMNVDENFDTPQKYQVSALPTILIFKEGKVVKTLVGLQSELAIQKVVDELASI